MVYVFLYIEMVDFGVGVEKADVYDEWFVPASGRWSIGCGDGNLVNPAFDIAN